MYISTESNFFDRLIKQPSVALNYGLSVALSVFVISLVGHGGRFILVFQPILLYCTGLYYKKLTDSERAINKPSLILLMKEADFNAWLISYLMLCAYQVGQYAYPLPSQESSRYILAVISLMMIGFALLKIYELIKAKKLAKQ